VYLVDYCTFYLSIFKTIVLKKEINCYRAGPKAKFIVKQANQKHAIDAFDISQGRIGDCWFLSSISALAQKRKLVKKVLMPQVLTKSQQELFYLSHLTTNGSLHPIQRVDFCTIASSESGSPGDLGTESFSLNVNVVENK